MALLVIQHPVAEFQAWKQTFDSDPMGRAINGVTRHSILRAADEPHVVVVHLEFESREKAQKFLVSLRKLWINVGNQIGFGSPEGVQARVPDEIERVDY